MLGMQCLFGHRWSRRRRLVRASPDQAEPTGGIHCLTLDGARVCWAVWSECTRCGAHGSLIQPS